MARQQIDISVNKSSADFWANVVSANICEMDFLRGERSAAGKRMLDSVRVGDLGISRYQSAGASSVSRRLDHIRKDCIDGFIITLPLTAEFRFLQNGGECCVLPGQFGLVATARPFRIKELSTSSHQELASLHVLVPGPLLRKRCLQIDDLCNCTLPILPGAGQMMRSLIAAAVRDGSALSDSSAQSLSDLLVDLIACAATQDAAISELVKRPREKARQHTLSIATSFISANLSNPSLDTTLVAAHCKVSVRYLQTLFESASMSVAASIRELRLQRCRDFLRSPDLANRTITEIAAVWGFDQPSYFTRAYKSRFGIAPSEERTIAQRISQANLKR